MNANLERLKALVAETNEVVANLNKETEDIKKRAREEKAKKYAAINEYLKECYEIAKTIGACFKIKIDIPDYHCYEYPAELYIRLDLKFGIDFLAICSNGNSYAENAKGYYYQGKLKVPRLPDKDNCDIFMDNWDQETFEKRFAAEVERAITEKAEKANKEYQEAVNEQGKHVR